MTSRKSNSDDPVRILELQGDVLNTSDPQAMLSTKDGNVTAVIWDFEQPEQKISNRPFFTKPVVANPAAPEQLKWTHLASNGEYRLAVHRTGYHANDAYSAFLEMELYPFIVS